MTQAALKPTHVDSAYQTDLCAWAEEQARLLRERRFDELDVPNLIDEVLSVGGSERQQIESRLDVLIGHLLRWMYQPGNRNSHWVGTILKQRKRIARVIQGNPGLKRYPAIVFEECYLAGRLLAAKAIGIDLMLFPEQPPFSLYQVLNLDYRPREPSSLAS
ncbi:DUF29 domain-containing protein [Methylobacterium sp. J-030]|uniref:DUF29 domain-containing protein n=1 Tax=Methylobacterium sp. J-030 TaxID=2836627 RepID=UPI001FB8CED4|nr:DUF29 domain-containing protein [Methylobacterium sp. J-030]MCJ2073712.1 DUF29 domain-containing protein [Methylobacterium sp. J-030]